MHLRDVATVIRTTGYLVRRRLPYYPIIASFDVTNRCTLQCNHCYWQEEGREYELDDETYYQKVVELRKRHPTLLMGIWLGGEPLLRADLVGRCKEIFPHNEVITNGTLPLPPWRDVRFACSVDGTKEYHEHNRGKHTYKRIKKHIDREDLNVNIICIITRLNQGCIEDFVEEWSTTHIRTIGFGFYTPIKGKDNETIWLDFKERDKVLDRISALKKRFPRIINTSTGVLQAFRSDRCRAITEHCRRDLAPYCSLCFDSAFNRKLPCVIGKDADCSRCGCGGAVIFEAVRQGDISTLSDQLKNVIPFL